MAPFLSRALHDLTRQLSYAPPRRRRQQMDAAERLYWQIEPGRNYPIDFIIYRITGYRPESSDDTTLVGEAVRKDLLRMVERLSESLEERAEDYDPPPLDLPGLCRRLNVSAKTISRYRRRGLFARRLVFADGRRKLAFLPHSVERFLAERPAQARRAQRFSRIDEPTRHRIITRARRIAARADVSPHRVARHLGRKLHRSTEAVRLLLLRHDRADPRVAIFPNHTPTLSEKQKRIIHRAYHRGVSVAKLAERFGKARNAIYRALNRSRARALRELPIRCVHHKTFDLPEAEEVILGSALPAEAEAKRSAGADGPAAPSVGDGPANARRTQEGPSGEAADGLGVYIRRLYEPDAGGPLDAAMEKALFVRYNYLKHRAAALRDKLDRYQPRSTDLDRIETYLRRAVAIKQRLVRANLRLVVSVARRHLGGGRRFDPQALADLISEGNLVLLEVIETFDAGRDNRFSTYLTWSLMRRFARAEGAMAAAVGAVSLEAGSGRPGRAYWPAALNPNIAALEHAEQVAHTLRRLLGELDERERLVVTRHFGLDDEGGRRAEPQTLAELAAELGVSTERTRQIEHRAIRKLREAALRLGLPAPDPDAAGPPRP